MFEVMEAIAEKSSWKYVGLTGSKAIVFYEKNWSTFTPVFTRPEARRLACRETCDLFFSQNASMLQYLCT